MKNNIRTKMLGLALTTTMALSVLTACGSSAETASLPSLSALASASPSSQEESNASVGTVLLSVNPEIEMDYDGHGNVTALTGRNQDAQALLSDYTGYEGRPCTEVIGELVQEISARGYFDTTVGGKERNVILKLEQGSAYPTDQFLEELAGAVRQVVATEQSGSQPVLLDQDDYDDVYGDKGYINASAAQSILSAQLGRDDLQYVYKRQGWFIFDVNTPFKHEKVLADNTFVYDLPDIYCVWQNTYNPQDGSVAIELDFFERQGKLYARSSERFSERAYSAEKLTALLREAGLDRVEVVGDMRFDAPAPDEQRMIFAAHITNSQNGVFAG